MSPDKNVPRKTSTVPDSLLLVLVCITIFLAPLFPVSYHRTIYSALYTGIFLTAALAVQRNRKVALRVAFGVAAVEWIGSRQKMPLLTSISSGLQIVVFVVIVVALITQIARTRDVTARVIIDSITGYLLVGLIFTRIVVLLMVYQPDAFSFAGKEIDPERLEYHLSDYFYFTFVTFATLGYGDVLPTKPYAKSLAILIAVVGQLYVATIIAMLIGKFATSVPEENKRE